MGSGMSNLSVFTRITLRSIACKLMHRQRQHIPGRRVGPQFLAILREVIFFRVLYGENPTLGESGYKASSLEL